MSDKLERPDVDAFKHACQHADWTQVVLNGGPPCFHLEGSRFCLRAERWQGHGISHPYVTLSEAVQSRIAQLERVLEAAERMLKVAYSYPNNLPIVDIAELREALKACDQANSGKEKQR